MQLTHSFLDLLQHLAPVFMAPTFQTFLQVASGWLLSQRHRYVTEVIFSGGNVGNGHWSRFHRFFSHAAWDIDAFSLVLTKLVVTIIISNIRMRVPHMFKCPLSVVRCRKRCLGNGQRTTDINSGLLPASLSFS